MQNQMRATDVVGDRIGKLAERVLGSQDERVKKQVAKLKRLEKEIAELQKEEGEVKKEGVEEGVEVAVVQGGEK